MGAVRVAGEQAVLLKSLRLARFTAFDNAMLSSSPGVNALVGANSRSSSRLTILCSQMRFSLSAKYRTGAAGGAPIRFFAFSRDDAGAVHVQPGDTLADLEHNPIMEESEALHDRSRRLRCRRTESRNAARGS